MQSISFSIFFIDHMQLLIFLIDHVAGTGTINLVALVSPSRLILHQAPAQLIDSINKRIPENRLSGCDSES